MITRTWKYELVGRAVAEGGDCVLVDVGARDRVLQRYLPSGSSYLSADVVPGHDLLWNLEQPIDAPDRAYDHVVALDVLEHLEYPHRALRELIRIARRSVFISLPNMSALSFRLTYFRTGRLSGKYDLLPQHQGDRHRWITRYEDVRTFVEHHARESGCTVRRWDIVKGFGTAQALAERVPLPLPLRTYTMLFELRRGG